MSTSDPSLSSAMEVIKRELEKLQNIKTAEIENIVRERDALKKEVESEKMARMYKARVLELEHNVSTAQAALSSNKRKCKRKAAEYSATVTEEATGTSLTEHDNEAKTPYIIDTTSDIPVLVYEITKNLKAENLEKFKQSCFGHLLKINEVRFQGQLFLQLLLHMDMTASNKECLVFNINNKTVKFGAREFSLVTGLRLGALEETTITTSSTQSKVFIGVKPTVLVWNIDKDVRSVSRRAGKGDDSTLLKLALLHSLYGILLAGNRCNKIDEEYLNLVEDLHKFNAFPWGRVAFEFLALSMLSVRQSYNSSKLNFTICGFSLALLVWVYEVMPSVAKYCIAVRAYSPEEDQIPRICCWLSLRKKIGLKDLEKFFTQSGEAHSVLEGIRASPWELEALTTGTTSRLQEEKSPIDKKHSRSATATTRAMTQTNGNPVERCLFSSSAEDVMIISDNEDDDDDEGAASSDSQSKNSDDDDDDDDDTTTKRGYCDTYLETFFINCLQIHYHLCVISNEKPFLLYT